MARESSIRERLRLYLFLRFRSWHSAVGENGMICILDTERAIGRLNPRDRTILIGRMSGLTIPQVAKIAGCSRATVERRIPWAEGALSYMLSGGE